MNTTTSGDLMNHTILPPLEETLINQTTNGKQPPRNMGPSLAFLLRPEPMETYQFISIAALLAIGLLSNIVNLIVLPRFKKTPFTCYMIGLATFDLLFCLVNWSLMHNAYTGGPHTNYTYCFYLAHIAPVLLFGMSGASSWLTVMMSVERFSVTLFPLKSMQWFSVKKAKITVVLIFISALILRIPFGFVTAPRVFNVNNQFLCFANLIPRHYKPYGETLLVAMAVIFEYIPIVLLVTLNVSIIISLQFASARRAELMGTKESASYRSTTFLLIAIFVMYILFEGNTSLCRYVPISDFKIALTYRHVTSILFTANHAANFFLYFVSNAEFRHVLFGILTGKNQWKSTSGSFRTSNGEKTSSIRVAATVSKEVTEDVNEEQYH